LSEKTRDNLIGYLATFDLLLSLTMPLTALDVLTKYWPLGPNTEFLARLTRAVPTALVYSSSMIITLIAINCYRQIINSSQRQLTPGIIRYLLIPIITTSLVISTPIYYFTKLDPVFVNVFKNMGIDINELYLSRPLEIHSVSLNVSAKELTTATTFTNSTNISEFSYAICKKYNDVKLSDISFVIDEWTIAEGWLKESRLYYSIFSILAQLIIPFFVISVSYYSVSKRLQKQAEIQTRVMRTDQRLRKENERNKKRNKLLVTISLVYLLTWLPLGIFGTLSDANIDFFNNDPKTISMVFVSCHLVGMASACVNPIIYGFRNKHVRQGNTTLIILLQSFN
jgi:neuropeptide Y receptor